MSVTLIDLNKPFSPADIQNPLFKIEVRKILDRIMGEFAPNVSDKEGQKQKEEFFSGLVSQAITRSAMGIEPETRMTRKEFIESNIVPIVKEQASEWVPKFQQFQQKKQESDYSHYDVDSSMLPSEKSYADAVLDDFNAGRITREQMLARMKEAKRNHGWFKRAMDNGGRL
jgi:hypothetical protein